MTTIPVQKFNGNAEKYYPTATFELFHCTTAVYVTTCIELIMLGGFIATYFIMETKGYFLQVEYFRPVIATVATLNFSGIVCAVLGVYKERRMLLQMHITILRSMMVFADMIALSVIVIMAIGNRWKTSERLPKYLVNEKLFYNFLGPFWMYLGAISLHITVAGNMCGLQVMNNCLRYFEEKERALQTTR